MVLRDGEDDGLSGGILVRQAGGEFLEVLMGEAVELFRRAFVCRRVRPAPLELGGVVFLAVFLKGIGKHGGDPLGEFVRDEVVVLECLLNGVGEIRLVSLAVVELVGVPLDVFRRGGGEADVEGIEVIQGCPPCAVDGAVSLIGDNEIKVAAGEGAEAAHHGLEQADGDLLVLGGGARLEPIAGVTGEDVLDGFEGLLGE